MTTDAVFQDSPSVNSASFFADPALPSFKALDDVYYADTCTPLTAAVDAGVIGMSALVRGHYPGVPLGESEVPGIRTVGYWDASQHQNWGLDWHRNEGIEITYLARGQLDFAVDDREWPLRSGQLTITRPWQRHRVGNPNVGPSRLHWCILDVDTRRPNQKWHWPSWLALSADDLGRLTQLLQHNEHPVWPAGRDVDETFEAMAQCVTNPNLRTRDSRLRQLVSRLLIDVLELLEKQSVVLDEELSSPRRSVQLFLGELGNYLDRKWSLGDMAESCELGRTRFAQYCQEITNMSPVEYLTSLRMSRAAELARLEPKLQITEIAFRCGYESSQYFSAAFTKQFGMSPRAWRSPRMSTTPPPIQRFIDATNAGDSEALLEAFTPDAFLSDWGRDFTGRDGIAAWNETDNIGVQSKFRLLGVEPNGADAYRVKLAVSGNGYNGEGTMAFTLTGGRISRLVIS